MVYAEAKSAKEKGLTEQYEILKDGKVTAAEYEDAVNLTIECHRSAGLEVKGPWLSPIDNLLYSYDVTIPSHNPSKTSEGVECEDAFLSYVQPNYLDQHEAKMSTDLKEATQASLTAMGLPVDKNDTSYWMMVETAGGPPVSAKVFEAVSTAMGKLYPQITGTIAAIR